MSEAEDNRPEYNILAFNFEGQNTAREALKQVRMTGALDEYLVQARAVLEQDENGEVHVIEPGHGIWGAVGGAAVGGLLGVLGGPIGLLTLSVAGAALGGVAGRRLGRVVPKEDLKVLGKRLVPNSSTLLFLLEGTQTEGVINTMKQFDADVLTMVVGDDVAAELTSYWAGTEASNLRDTGSADAEDGSAGS